MADEDKELTTEDLVRVTREHARLYHAFARGHAVALALTKAEALLRGLEGKQRALEHEIVALTERLAMACAQTALAEAASQQAQKTLEGQGVRIAEQQAQGEATLRNLHEQAETQGAEAERRHANRLSTMEVEATQKLTRLERQHAERKAALEAELSPLLEELAIAKAEFDRLEQRIAGRTR